MCTRGIKKGDLIMTKVKNVQPKQTPIAQNGVKKEAPKTQNNPNSIMVGGVKFDAKDVKSYSTTKGTFAGPLENAYQDSEHHEVVLKDGTKLEYDSTLRDDDYYNTNRKHLERQAEVQFEKDGTINFKGLSHVTIRDTQQDDTYKLLGCEFTMVDAARTKDKKSGLILIDHDLVSADKDKIIFGDRMLPDGTTQKSDYSKAFVRPGDYVTQAGESYPERVKGETQKFQTLRGMDDGYIIRQNPEIIDDRKNE